MTDVAITVSGTKYPLKVLNYQKVDITDFAPKAFSSSQTFSTMGLYTDATQEGFGHGFGDVEFADPQRYHYSGQLVDTRHDFISLYTNYTTDFTLAVAVTKMLFHRNIQLTGASTGLILRRPSTGAAEVPITGVVNDLLETGRYFLVSRAARMKLCDVGLATSGTTTTLTLTGAGWETNVWAGATVYIYDGTGYGESSTVSSNTGSVLTFSPAITAPNSTSYFIVYKDTGLDANPPTGFGKLAIFGGSYWSYQTGTNFVHFWSEESASDAEGGATADAAVVLVGPATTNRYIVNILPFQNQLWVFKADGAWVINEQDTDTLAYHTLDFSTETSLSNFATVLVWQGFLIFAVRNKLYKYRSGLQDISPPVWDTYPPYKTFGDFRGLVARGKFLYVLARSNEANSDEATETTTGFVTLLAHDGVGWHRLVDIPLTTPTSPNSWYDPTADRIYFMGLSGGTGSMYYVPLQAYSDLPYATFPTTGNHNLYTSYYDFTYKRVPKSFASLTLHGDFPTGTSVIVHYRVDTTLTWTSLGTFDTDFEAVNFATGVTGTRIQFRLNLQTSNAANTPVIKALVIKLMMRPAVLYGVYCDVQVSSDLVNAQQRVLGLTSREIETALLAARDSVSPITFTDAAGTDETAYLASLKFRLAEFADSEGLQYIAQCTFVFI